MPLPLYYFLAITAVNILMSWALYLPYRVAHLHFITVANMAISGYTAAYLVMNLHVPFGWALVAGFALGGIIGYVVSLFIGDAPTFAVVIVGFTFIYITRTVIENLKAVGGTMGMFGLPNIGGKPRRAPLDDDRHPLRPAPRRGVPHPPLRPFAAGQGRLRGVRGQGARRLPRRRHQEARDAPADLQLHHRRRRRGALRLHLQELPPDFFTFALVGIAMTIIFVGGYATQWGSLVLAPILYGVPLLFPSCDPVLAHRHLWRASDPGAGAETGGFHHAAVRLYY